jgi:hypothetical protein
VAAHREVFAAEYQSKSLEWQSHQLLILRLLMGIPERHLQVAPGPASLNRLLLDFLHIRTDIAPPISLLSRIGHQREAGVCIFSRLTSEMPLPSQGRVAYQVLLVNASWMEMFPSTHFSTGEVVKRDAFEAELSKHRLDVHRLCRDGRRCHEQRTQWSPSRGYRLLNLCTEFVLDVRTLSERREVYLTYFHDVTLNSRIEEALLYGQLQATRSELLKQTLLASVAHELRTPLSAIVGFAELAERRMQKREGSAGDEDVLAMLSDIRLAGCHLLQTVTDVLDLSKLHIQPRKMLKVNTPHCTSPALGLVDGAER